MQAEGNKSKKSNRGAFDINSYLYEINQIDTGRYKTDNDNALYGEVLNAVRHEISTKYSDVLMSILNDTNGEKRLKAAISKVLITKKLTTDMSSSETIDAIYNDMASFKFLTPYIKDNPDIEEININGKSGIWITDSKGKRRLGQKFDSAEDCQAIVQKLSALGGVIMDGSKPFGDSYISRGVRMSGAIAPCVDPEQGAIASIRKQKPSFITRERLIEGGTASEDELDLITICLNHGASIANCGSTGAGKTGLNGYLLSTIPNDRRIVVIEDTKEMDLLKIDELGLAQNDVVQLSTQEGRASMLDLLVLSLRLHPQNLVPAEMRGAEAMVVQEAARTGHTVLTSLHADDALEGYSRILTMCMLQNSGLSESRLLKLIVSAFPIMIFSHQLDDDSRRIMELFEATGVKDGEVQGQMLYEFIIKKRERDASGKVLKVIGEHKQVGRLSERLKKRLIRNGCDENDLARFCAEGGE